MREGIYVHRVISPVTVADKGTLCLGTVKQHSAIQKNHVGNVAQTGLRVQIFLTSKEGGAPTQSRAMMLILKC